MRKYIISFFSIIMFLSSAFSVNATPGNLKSVPSRNAIIYIMDNIVAIITGIRQVKIVMVPGVQ